MRIAKIFKSGNSQTMISPAEFQFDTDEEASKSGGRFGAAQKSKIVGTGFSSAGFVVSRFDGGESPNQPFDLTRRVELKET